MLVNVTCAKGGAVWLKKLINIVFNLECKKIPQILVHLSKAKKKNFIMLQHETSFCLLMEWKDKTSRTKVFVLYFKGLFYFFYFKIWIFGLFRHFSLMLEAYVKRVTKQKTKPVSLMMVSGSPIFLSVNQKKIHNFI